MTEASALDLPGDDLFGADNLPYGLFTDPGPHDARTTPDGRDAGQPRIGVRYGAYVLDAGAAATEFGSPHAELLREPLLNPLLAAGRPVWQAVRAELREWLTGGSERRAATARHLRPLAEVELRLPFEVADYVDFYASEHHAANVGRIFRPGSDPLTPNWKHLPIGYHGRAGTVVVSGTPVVRPRGQRKPPTAEAPLFGPSTRLDIEAEVAFVSAPRRGWASRSGRTRSATTSSACAC